MRRHSSANVLLLELLIVIFFFMLCFSTIVETFGLAKQKSNHALAVNQVMMEAENLAARFYASGDPAEMLAENGFVSEEGRWVRKEEQYVLYADLGVQHTEAGLLRSVLLTAVRGEDTLFEMPLTQYVPGEVSP